MGKLLLLLITGMVTVSVRANALSYTYICYSYYWNGDINEKGTLELTADKVTAQASLKSEQGDLLERFGGSRNSKYKSKGIIRYAKFEGGLIVEESLLSGGRTLKDGSSGGLARVEGEEDGGFYQYKFICKAQ